MKHGWRYLGFATADAATNMALDEATLEAHLAGIVPPTLRLYGFEPGALSFGRAQDLPEALRNRAQAMGLDVVRRPTGGRAVLHVKDLTYAFVGTSKHGQKYGFLEESVSGSYRQICRGLQNAFELLGLRLEPGRAAAPYRHRHDCFLATTGSDLQINGRKMVGSAQLRRRWAVLQHGSILLAQDESLAVELYGAAASENHHQPRHVNLFDILGAAVCPDKLHEAIRLGFQSAFQVEFQPGGLTAFEIELADRLLRSYRRLDELRR